MREGSLKGLLLKKILHMAKSHQDLQNISKNFERQITTMEFFLGGGGRSGGWLFLESKRISQCINEGVT